MREVELLRGLLQVISKRQEEQRRLYSPNNLEKVLFRAYVQQNRRSIAFMHSSQTLSENMVNCFNSW